ncbi:MAG: methyltransferase type 12 [Candidatus Competibacteraceae bacterium]|nr:methyltransferase type 12 [Candidatus Competibacteraceae bacterium]
MNENILFLKEFIKNPGQVSSIVPSSRFLEQRIVKLAAMRSAKTVVELGAGVGGTTQAFLDALPPEAKLLSIEINPKFCTLLRRIQDPRLIVHCGGAQELQETMALYGLPAPEAVVSGIPFSKIEPDTGSSIIKAVASALAVGGRFVAYQVSGRVAELARPLLGPGRFGMELLNIPPLRVYQWEKAAA